MDAGIPVTSKIIGVDVGGTFTDVVAVDEQSGRISVYKTPSTPANQAEGILTGIAGLHDDFKTISRIVHGTTVATNTVLEGNGARVALITTAGFRDTLEIGRCRRMMADSMFNTKFVRPPPLVPRHLRFEVSERLSASGAVLRPLDDDEVLRIAELIREAEVTAVAVCFLHSYLNPVHEKRAKDLLVKQLQSVMVCTSSEILPEIREYERFSTTTMNAFIAPVMRRYITSLTGALKQRSYGADLYTMASHGGIMSSESTIAHPIRTVLSGPASGVNGAIFLGALAGFRNLITYDMGGTSTDVCLIEDLKPLLATSNIIAGMPINTPQLDIHAVGAGGGSIAWVDIDGSLKVGPRSAGAVPGPACYAKGGTALTITDANVVLGRLGATLLDGRVGLDRDLARGALKKLAAELGDAKELEWLAEGVIQLAVATMAGAVRKISIERGFDPRDFSLVAMGGAGPMHAVLVAEELGIPSVLVPQWPGNICALGLLAADLRHDYVRTYLARFADVDLDDVEEVLGELSSLGSRALLEEGVPAARISTRRYADLRFVGQAYELTIELPQPVELDAVVAAFHDAYKRRFGHDHEEAVEIVNLRTISVGQTPRPVLSRLQTGGTAGRGTVSRDVFFQGQWHATPVMRRDALEPGEIVPGPAIVEEFGTTTVVPPLWSARVLEGGAIEIRRREGA
jgi:N-methylhydantoinase A